MTRFPSGITIFECDGKICAPNFEQNNETCNNGNKVVQSCFDAPCILPFLECSVTSCSSCESDPNKCNVCNEGLKLNPVKTACTIEDGGKCENTFYGTDIFLL